MPGTTRVAGSHARSELKANRRSRPRQATVPKQRPNKLWLALLTLWLALLSGAAAPWTGTPGVLQQLHLRHLLDTQHTSLTDLQSEIDHLRSEASELEHSRAVQQREIRRILGYAAADEIIFEFPGQEN